MFGKFRALKDLIVERQVVANQTNSLLHTALHTTRDKALVNLQHVDAIGLNAFNLLIINDHIPVTDEGHHVVIADLQHFDVVRQTKTA